MEDSDTAAPPKPTATYSETNSSILPARNGDATAEIVWNDGASVEHSSLDYSALGSGDTFFCDFLTRAEADEFLHNLTPKAFGGAGEIDFQQWYHMPHKKTGKLEPLRRTKIAMGRPAESDASTTSKSMPLYRFPVNDQQRYGIFPFSTTIERLREKVMAHFAANNSELKNFDFNHSVVLFYKDGEDCIGFHKDKTLDLVDGSPIVSVSTEQTGRLEREGLCVFKNPVCAR